MEKFTIRSYSIHDFKEWEEKGELVLTPKFQRREVWSGKAKSYLIDTIIRGLPIPAIYMRQEINPKTRSVYREVVDGQQRLKAILSFIEDGFKISKIHNDEFGGLYFSQLPPIIQRNILNYELMVNLLVGATDKEIYEIFARLNTYTVKLNPQELRNSQFFGMFKRTVYELSFEYNSFWIKNNIFTEKNITRMLEAEFVSEILIAMLDGIRGKRQKLIDKFYKEYDEHFPRRKEFMDKFRKCMDVISEIMGEDLPASIFRYSHMFYSLFLVIYDFLYGLPNSDIERISIRKKDYPKIKNALEEIDELLKNIDEMLKKGEKNLPEAYIEFYMAFKSHTTGAKERKIRHKFIASKILEAVEP